MLKTVEAAHGKWGNILATLGVPAGHLRNVHGPCPICEGKDRFRFDNRNGTGSWICSKCGAGKGMKLLMEFNRWDFRTAASEVDRVIGKVAKDPLAPADDPEANRIRMGKLWERSVSITPGNLAHAYLSSRVSLSGNIPTCLRFVEDCPAPDRIARPAMIALVKGPDGNGVNIHRTFLSPAGKANMDEPRALMKGRLPDGSSVRLFPKHGESLGIAEGIETALAASERFDLPVWAALNSAMMAKWTPPPSVKEVWVFGDNDEKFGGQAAAFTLAHRLAARLHLRVRMEIPSKPGRDWADDDAE